MKTIFTKQELLSRKGCYSSERIEKLFPNNNDVTINEILSIKSVSLKDKHWFIYNSCELSLDEKKELSLLLSWAVLPLFENIYPNDETVRKCMDGIERFKKNLITVEELIDLKNAAIIVANKIDQLAAYSDDETFINTSYAAASTAYAAAHDAYADTALVAHDSHAAYAGYAAVNAATSAFFADAVKYKSYSEKLNNLLIEFASSK